MQLVTDRAADITAEQLEQIDLNIYYLPLEISLDGKQYTSGIDIQPQEFYKLLETSEGMPSTSQPSPGTVAEIYRRVVEETGDKDILSVHISAGLSGTPNAARLAAEQVSGDGINVHIIDTHTLSGAQGWQVEAAARALKAGQSVDQIEKLLSDISDATDTLFTLPDLKYLIHGGRIGHLKGLVASTLGIKPLIGVDKTTGKYAQRGSVRTFKRAIQGIADHITRTYPQGSKLRVQALHAYNPDGVEALQDAMAKTFDVDWLPVGTIAPVLGAHTGAGLVGVTYAPLDQFPDMPS